MKFERFVLLLLLHVLCVDSFNSRLKRPWDKPKLGVPTVTDRANQVLFYTDHDLEYPKETKHHAQHHQTAATRPTTIIHNNNQSSPSIIQNSYNTANSTEDNIAWDVNGDNNNNNNNNDQNLKTEIVVAPIRQNEGPPPTLSSEPLIKDYIPELLKMARVANFPGVILFHMIGTWLAFCQYQIYANPPAINQMITTYWSLLMSPPMILTLISLLFTSSTSMLVNDYYDFKLGNDANKPLKALQKVPLAVCKKALYYLYAMALLTVNFLPGVPARFAVTGGLILTFLYTKHVKPRTW